MPILKNSRHEKFAHLVAQGETTGKAYVGAGYSENGADRSGHKLLKKAEIKARIKEIKANIAKIAEQKVAIDKAWVLDKLQEIAIFHQIKNPNAANRALELIGKELGMFKEQLRVGDPDDKPIKNIVINVVGNKDDLQE